MQTAWGGLIGFALSAAARAAEPQSLPSLAESLPEEILFYAAIENPAGFREKTAGTALGKTWREEEIQDSARELKTFLEKEGGREAKPYLAALRFLMKVPLARCECAAWVENENHNKDKPALKVAALLVGPEAMALAQHFEAGIKRHAPDLARTLQWGVGGGFLWAKGSDGGLTVLDATKGKACFLVLTLEGALDSKKDLAILSAPAARPLAASPSFKRVRAACGDLAGGALFCYANLAAAKARLTDTPGLVQELELDPEMGAFPRILGLDRVEGAGLAFVPEGDGFREILFLDAPAGLTGFFEALSLAPRGPWRSFGRLPEKCLAAAAAKIPWQALVKAARAGVPHLSEEDRRDLQGDVTALQKEAGIRVEEDLLSALGEECAFSLGKPGAGLIPIPPLTVLIEVKDAKKVEACLEKLAAYAAAEGAPYTKTPYAGWTLYNFGGGRDPGGMGVMELGMLFQPTFVVTETHLAASTSPQALKSLLSAWKRPGFQGLAADERFKQVASKIPEGTVSATYMDLPEIVTLAYNTLLQFTGLAQGFGGQNPGFNLNALPSSEVLTRYLMGAVVATNVARDCVAIEGWSPIGLNLLPLDPTLIGVWGTAAFVGSMQSCRQQKDFACRCNLSAFHMHWNSYGTTHGKFPARLSDLLKEKTSAHLSLFYCPLDEGRPSVRRYLQGKEAVQWLADHPASYAYVRKNATAPGGDLSSRVVVFEKMPRHRGRRHVLFADGHIDLVEEEKFQRLAKEQGLLAAPRAPVELTPAVEARIVSSVKDLGDADFQKREAATVCLEKTGPVAREHLRRAAESEDPEIRSRAARIVEAWEEGE